MKGFTMAYLKVRAFKAVEGPNYCLPEEFASREFSPEGTKELSSALQRSVGGKRDRVP